MKKTFPKQDVDLQSNFININLNYNGFDKLIKFYLIFLRSIVH